MPKKFTSKSQKIGEIGESVTVRYLESKGYQIIERNYTRPCGEIDIVAKRQGKVYFVEVKAQKVSKCPALVTPEENVHSRKVSKLRKVIALYLRENHASAWQFCLAVVSLHMDTRRARVVFHENLVL